MHANNLPKIGTIIIVYILDTYGFTGSAKEHDRLKKTATYYVCADILGTQQRVAVMDTRCR